MKLIIDSYSTYLINKINEKLLFSLMKKTQTRIPLTMRSLSFRMVSSYLFVLVPFALSAVPVPSFTDISVLDAAQISSLISIPASNQLGVSISSTGDFNNDGFQDIIIGVPAYSMDTGVAYVIFGTSSGIGDIDFSTTDLYTSNRGFKITGPSASSAFGMAVANAGDFNNDGIDDIIIGAYSNSAGTGKVYIIFGRSSGSSNIDLGTDDLLSLQRGFMITGGASSYFGISVDGAGDVNNDGFDDVVIGAFGLNAWVGGAFIVFGKSSGYSNINLASTNLYNNNLGFRIDGSAAAHCILE